MIHYFSDCGLVLRVKGFQVFDSSHAVCKSGLQWQHLLWFQLSVRRAAFVQEFMTQCI